VVDQHSHQELGCIGYSRVTAGNVADGMTVVITGTPVDCGAKFTVPYPFNRMH
jgi:hypothetical protein